MLTNVILRGTEGLVVLFPSLARSMRAQNGGGNLLVLTCYTDLTKLNA